MLSVQVGERQCWSIIRNDLPPFVSIRVGSFIEANTLKGDLKCNPGDCKWLTSRKWQPSADAAVLSLYWEVGSEELFVAKEVKAA